MSARTGQTPPTAPEVVPEVSGREDDAVSGGRVFEWMPYVLVAGLLLAIVRWTSAPIYNADTFFHLRYGDEFLHSWSLWHPGHVSTFGQRDWVPTQWASQMAMAAMESAFGLPGVAWLSGVLVIITVVAVFVVARQYADPLPSVVVAVMVVLATSGNLTSRPQVVSYLFILMVTHAWLQSAKDLRPRWWLVPLTWVWACLHGMWPVGAMIGLVAVLGIVLDRGGELRERRRWLQLLAVPLLSLVVAALTPVGPKLYSAVLLVGGRSKFHLEWAATDFHERQPAIVAVLIALTLVLWLRAPVGRRPSWTAILLLLMAAGWSAYAMRTVPVAVMMTVPLVAGALQSLVHRRRPGVRRERLVVGLLATLALLALTVAVPFTADREASVPSWLNPTLDSLPDGTTVLTSDVDGGYLQWRHPELNPVIDGYSDAYTTAHLQEQLDLQNLEPGWDRILRKDDVRYALLRPETRLAYALSHGEKWRTLHVSPDLVMLEAPQGQAQ